MLKAMKIPVTDQFLLDIIRAASKMESVFKFLIHPPKRMRDITLMNDDLTYVRYYKKLYPQKFSRLISILKKHNLIRVENLKNKKAIILTKEGISKALKAEFKSGNGKKRNDGKWIMIAFDIPQRHQKSRNLLRSVLKNLGYKMFQQSIWVTPYDVSEKTEAALRHYSLDQYVKIFLIEEL